MGDDAVLEVQDRVLPHTPATRLEDPSEQPGVARLISALARQPHPQVPGLLWEVAERARGARSSPPPPAAPSAAPRRPTASATRWRNARVGSHRLRWLP